jgi:hypothetical protein
LRFEVRFSFKNEHVLIADEMAKYIQQQRCEKNTDIKIPGEVVEMSGICPAMRGEINSPHVALFSTVVRPGLFRDLFTGRGTTPKP